MRCPLMLTVALSGALVSISVPPDARSVTGGISIGPLPTTISRDSNRCPGAAIETVCLPGDTDSVHGVLQDVAGLPSRHAVAPAVLVITSTSCGPDAGTVVAAPSAFLRCPGRFCAG